MYTGISCWFTLQKDKIFFYYDVTVLSEHNALVHESLVRKHQGRNIIGYV